MNLSFLKMIKILCYLIVYNMMSTEFQNLIWKLALMIWWNIRTGHVIEHLAEIPICSASYVHYTYWWKIIASLLCFPSREIWRDYSRFFCIMKNLCPTLDPEDLTINFEKWTIIVFSKIHPNMMITISVQILNVFNIFYIFIFHNKIFF